MSNQVIKGNVGELYVLKTGEIRDQIGLNDFHPTSNTNVLIVNIEDGGGENTQAQINFAPQSRPNWSSVWFPLFFVGHFSKRISNESAVRTFAQYKIIVPSIVLAMNLNSAYAMPVKITFRQIGGLEFLGQFDSATILQLEHPATQELSEELAVAYVYDGARSGFYQVEYNDELEIYEWVKTDNPTAHIQTKGYNMGEIKIQGGFGNNAPIQTISNAQYTLIWQELANHSQRINNIENQLESLMLDFEQQIEDVAQDLEDHIKDKSNPHETNADNAEYESGVSIKQKIDSDKQVLDDHVSDKENPHDVTAEQVDTYNKTTIDNKDADTLQAAKDYTDILGVDVEQNKQDIEDIKDGTTVVKKAEQDENGNNIKDTYATVTYVDGRISGVFRPSGNWNANTNTPTLANNEPTNAGKVYYVTDAGTQFGLTFAIGDKLAFIEGGVATKWDNVDDVTSVNGKVGTVVINADDIPFNGSGTNYLVNKLDVESAVKELDTQVELRVKTSDIVDNLNSNDTDKPLSANQGKVLNDTTAKLAVSNVFTQPQQVPNATLPQHATNKLQVETMFEMFKRELRGYNIAMPDLTGATDLGGGVYRVANRNGVTVDFNVYNGEYIINGTPSIPGRILRFPQSIVGNYTISYYYISGQVASGYLEFSRKSGAPGLVIGSSDYMNDRNVTIEFTSDFNQLDFTAYAGSNYIDLTFKLQLEKGSTATPYTVPGQIPQYKIVGEE